jgi:hypothetical protein
VCVCVCIYIYTERERDRTMHGTINLQSNSTFSINEKNCQNLKINLYGTKSLTEKQDDRGKCISLSVPKPFRW